MKMKLKTLAAGYMIFLLAISSVVAADIPEPGLVMYGAVRNTADGTQRPILIRSRRREEAPFNFRFPIFDCRFEVGASSPRLLPSRITCPMLNR
jgi:hypothetical protein